MRDLRLSVRALLATPVVSAVAILSLAIGIGANTAVFSVVNGLLLRPLPVSDPSTIVTISSDFAIAHGFRAGVGWNDAMWRRLRDRIGQFGGAVAWSGTRLRLEDGSTADSADVLFVDGEFFNTLGIRAQYGRMFGEADDVKGSPNGRVAVISHQFWQRHFSRDSSVIGKPVVVEGTTFTVAGVAPPEFFGIEVGRTFDIALPIASEAAVRGGKSMLDSDGSYLLIVMLRLKRGQSIQAATAALRAIHPDLLGVTRTDVATVNPAFLREPFVLLPAATGTSDRGARAQLSRPLLVVSIGMALVLLVGSLNLANLLLGRAAARRHELSVRAALGASRWRQARQAMVESLVVSVAGAILGVWLAMWGAPALVWWLSNANITLSLYLPFDWRVLAFTAAVAACTTMLFGIVPAYRAARITPDLLRSQHAAPVRRRGGVAGSFVVVQLALSIALVAGTGLFARTFQRLANAPLGFEPAPVLVMEVGAGRSRVPADARLDLYGRILDRVRAVPGVGAAAASGITPLGTIARSALYEVPGRIPENPITPGWFSVYGTRLLAGRDFSEQDIRTAPPVAIVNESYVRTLASGASPLGQPLDAQARMADARAAGGRTVIGVVADAVFGSIRQGPRPTIYLPLAQTALARDTSAIRVSVRATEADQSVLIRSLAAAVAEVDPDVSLGMRRLADDVSASIAPERALATLSVAFGVLALLLAGLGLYGVTATAVAARQRELAIRMAVGMAPARAVRLLLSRVGFLLGAGAVAGVSLSVWLATYVASMLYGLNPRDPVVIAGAASMLLLVGLVAGWIPARRAARIDPAVLLRQS